MSNLSLLDRKIQSTPTEFANYLKEQGDIFWWEKGNFWVITSHAHAREILISEDYTCDRSSFFISRMPSLDLSLIGDFFNVVGKMMVMSDAPAHTARRRICYDGFSHQTLGELNPLIAKTIDTQLNACSVKGEIELVEDLAKIIPSTILADFFDIPAAEREQFYEWSNNMTQFFGGSSQYRNEDGIQVNHSASSLRNYFIELIRKRRLDPKNDFLSILLRNQQAFGLDDDEIVSQAIMMLVAGQVTTTDQLCNNMYTLLTQPGALSLLRNNLADLEVGIDELNRLDPAVTFIFRVTKRDTYIGEQAIKAGDVIFISTHAVNRDARVFENPDEFQLARKNGRELSYGFGSHYCIGAKLARLEMVICIRELLVRFPALRLSNLAIPRRKHHSLSFSGFEHLLLDCHP